MGTHFPAAPSALGIVGTARALDSTNSSLAYPLCIGPSYLHAHGGEAQLVRFAWLPRTTEPPAQGLPAAGTPLQTLCEQEKANIPRFVMRHFDKEGKSIMAQHSQRHLRCFFVSQVEGAQPRRVFPRSHSDSFTVLSRAASSSLLHFGSEPRR
jgi:hypothetical protein